MKYHVVFEPFAERHYIKSFAKKHPGAWDRTQKGIILEFSLFDLLVEKSIAEPMSDKNAEVSIWKTEFKIAGTQESRHGSGNRCIVAINKETASVHVLLVYAKTDVSGTHETNWWKGMIRENYPDYAKMV